MRKWNAVLSAMILVLFIIHGIFGAFQLLGAGNVISRGLSLLLIALVLIHTGIGCKLTMDTLRAQRKAGTAYWKENKLFWTRRISGLAVMLLLSFHVFAFSFTTPEGFTRLQWFDTGKLMTQILLVAALTVHVLSNVRPLMISFGARSLRGFAGDLLFVLSILLLLMGTAFVVYYLRWNVL